jgi:UDP-N-acetylmuramoylalanine--D-glutamate ligase
MATTNGLHERNGIPQVSGKRVLVYSLGMEGRDLARWLLANGAIVTMSDTRTDAQLQAARAVAPDGVSKVVTGRGLLAPDGFDLVAVSQSVLRYDPALLRARESGVPITSQMRLFLQLCRGRTIGITGSSGKSTTTALVGAMARESGIRHVIGGNIGEALLGRLDEITLDTAVILEISHTQLQYTDRSPNVAAVTNVTPNHLDQFSWDEYVGLKRNILAYQGESDIAVLNTDDQTSRGLLASVRGQVARASLDGEVPGEGAWLSAGSIVARQGRLTHEVCGAGAVRLRGRHNLANVVMATAIGAVSGFEPAAMARAIAGFRGVPHRLEVVGRVGGVTWINDSIATAPERTIAGLSAFAEPVVLLLGGRDKRLPMEELQALMRERCRAVVCFGEAGPVFLDAARKATSAATLVATMDEAVSEAAGLAKAGDVVLLSPAGTSFDAYPNFETRGEAFRALVRSMPGFEPEVTP